MQCLSLHVVFVFCSFLVKVFDLLDATLFPLTNSFRFSFRRQKQH